MVILRTRDAAAVGSWINLLNDNPWPKTLALLKKSFAASNDAAPNPPGIRPSNWSVQVCPRARVASDRIDAARTGCKGAIGKIYGERRPARPKRRNDVKNTPKKRKKQERTKEVIDLR